MSPNQYVKTENLSVHYKNDSYFKIMYNKITISKRKYKQ